MPARPSQAIAGLNHNHERTGVTDDVLGFDQGNGAYPPSASNSMSLGPPPRPAFIFDRDSENEHRTPPSSPAAGNRSGQETTPLSVHHPISDGTDLMAERQPTMTARNRVLTPSVGGTVVFAVGRLIRTQLALMLARWGIHSDWKLLVTGPVVTTKLWLLGPSPSECPVGGPVPPPADQRGSQSRSVLNESRSGSTAQWSDHHPLDEAPGNHGGAADGIGWSGLGEHQALDGTQDGRSIHDRRYLRVRPNRLDPGDPLDPHLTTQPLRSRLPISHITGRDVGDPPGVPSVSVRCDPQLIPNR